MNRIHLNKADSGYSVCLDGENIGMVTLRDNQFHRTNAYVTLDLTRWEQDWAAELFEALRKEAGRPLQVMTSSEDTRLTEFLTAGGFVRARKCYELEVSAGDYIGPAEWGEPVWVSSWDEDYDRCCRLLYEHYRKTHEAVNPLTAEYSVFRASLPEDAVCEKLGGDIVALAFVEENEIAYVWGRAEDTFLLFAAALVHRLFESNGTVCFECDDCDRPALWLRAMFKPQGDTSFDTYIYQ